MGFKDFFYDDRVLRIVKNNDYVSNYHFIISKKLLTKKQLEFIDQFDNKGDTDIKRYIDIYNNTNKDTLTKFIPSQINSTTLFHYGNDFKLAIDEKYYDYFTSNNCELYLSGNNYSNPLLIYKKNNFVGLLMPINFKPELAYNAIDYQEYKQLKEKAKENFKKCLYIKNNKAIVRNKELSCIADIVNDKAFRNLYVEADYQNDYGMVFIDFGFILMSINRIINKFDDIERIKENFCNCINITFDDYKKYINNCLESMQFVNVADIKLMELAGESKEYIQQLIDHREKVLQLREQEYQVKRKEREEKDRQYVEEKNRLSENEIIQAEKMILNKGKINNKTITIYGKSQYDSKDISLILHLMKLYDIKIPLKTQGWINKALANIFYCQDDQCWKYSYYKTSVDSNTFRKYLNQLINKIS